MVIEKFGTLEEFEGYVSKRANNLRLTPPRPVKVVNAEEELQSRLHRLVAQGKRKSISAGQVLRQELGNRLVAANLGSYLQTDVVVHPPALPMPIKAPFAYRNGKLNLIEPLVFADRAGKPSSRKPVRMRCKDRCWPR